MPGRSPVWSACRWVRNTASRRGKPSPASAKADGDPRPQSMTQTRSPTTSADEIPARPATGKGPPAVPSSTSSVAMLIPAFLQSCLYGRCLVRGVLVPVVQKCRAGQDARPPGRRLGKELPAGGGDHGPGGDGG